MIYKTTVYLLRLALSIGLCFVSCKASCQTRSPQFDINVGVGKSDIRRNGPTTTYRPRSVGAAYLGYVHPISGSFGVRLDVGYEEKGSLWIGHTHNDPVTNEPVEEKLIYNFQYIRSQIALRYFFWKGRLYTDIGGYYGHMAVSELVFPEQRGLPRSTSHLDFKNYDLGVLATFGANFPISDKFGLTASVQSTLGLKDISVVRDIINGKNVHLVRNETILIRLGACYKLRRSDD